MTPLSTPASDSLPNLAVVVPARGGSKRVPGKNMRDLAGKPLLAHTAQAIAEAGLTKQTVLTSDSPEIIDAAKTFGWHVPFIRPSALASDEAGTAETVLDALARSHEALGYIPEWVLVLQPTSPFRSGDDIRTALSMAKSHQDCDGVIGVRGIGLPARYIVGEGPDGYMEGLVPTSDTRKAYLPNGAIYLIRTGVLEHSKSFYVGHILPLVMTDRASIDIDTEDDLAIAEAIAARQTALAANHEPSVA